MKTTMKHHYPDCQGGPTCNCDEREREEMEREVCDTPETDKCAIQNPHYLCGLQVVTREFARKLERERDEARKAAECLRGIHYEPEEEAKRPFPWEDAGDE